jgi:hypothetical protein
MRHEAKIGRQAEGHSKIAKIQREHNPEELPQHVDRKKLERAYKKLEDYEFVPRKKAGRK